MIRDSVGNYRILGKITVTAKTVQANQLDNGTDAPRERIRSSAYRFHLKQTQV